MVTSEAFLKDTKNNYSDILLRYQQLEESFKKLEYTNSSLLLEISRLNKELAEKIKEIESMAIEIKRIREEELILFTIKIDTNEKPVEENLTKNIENEKAELEYKIKFMTLNQEYQILDSKNQILLSDNKNYKSKCEDLERNVNNLHKENNELKDHYNTKISEFEKEEMNNKLLYENLTKFNGELESQIKNNISQMQLLEDKLSKISRETQAKDQKIQRLEEDSKSYSEIFSQANSEKQNFSRKI